MRPYLTSWQSQALLRPTQPLPQVSHQLRDPLSTPTDFLEATGRRGALTDSSR